MATGPTSLFVCVSCRRLRPGTPQGFDVPGPDLVARLVSLLADEPDLMVTPVECLAVCKRPCTIALSAEGKWTYLIGDLDPAAHADEIAGAARAFAASENGIVPWRERPATFRRGVVARVPPVNPGPQETPKR